MTAAQPPVVIDLGERREFSVDSDRPRRRRPGTATAAGLALLVLLGVPAAEPPAGLRPVLDAPVGEVALRLDRDALYARDERSGAVAAYRLTGPGAGPRGAGPAEPVMWRADGPVDDVAVVAGATLLSRPRCPDPEVYRLDPGGGPPRWRAAGRVTGVVAAGPRRGLVVVERAPPTCIGERGAAPGDPRAGPPPPIELVALDAATGEHRWGVTLPAGAYVVPGTDGFVPRPAIPVAHPDGTVAVLDPATGAQRARAAMPPAAPAGAAGPVQLRLVGDVLVAHVPAGTGSRTAAFALADLRPRWERVSTVHRSGPFLDCRPYICMVTPDELTALDVTTGQPAAEPGPVRPTRHWYGLRTVRRQGRVPLPGFGVIGETVDGGLLSGRFHAGRTTFARTGPGGGRTRVVGVRPGLYLRCLADDRHLACLTLDGRLRAWRLPP